MEGDLQGSKGYILFTSATPAATYLDEPGGINPPKPVKTSNSPSTSKSSEELEGIEDFSGLRAALLVVDPINGEILAMVDILRDPDDVEPFPWADDPYYKPKARPPFPPFPSAATGVPQSSIRAPPAPCPLATAGS